MSISIRKLINHSLGFAGFRLHRIPSYPSWKLPLVSALPQHCFANCRVLASRTELAKAMPRSGVVAEIGVANGDFSTDILSFNAPSALYLVDSWENARYQQGFEYIQSRFAQQIKAGAVILNRGRSIDILPTLPVKSFDWLYLDTTHEYTDTLQELYLCESIVKDGGYIAGHDFCVGNPYSAIPYGVIRAVYEFCTERNWGFEYITLDSDGDFSFCLQQR
jgi:hypothetical protein